MSCISVHPTPNTLNPKETHQISYLNQWIISKSITETNPVDSCSFVVVCRVVLVWVSVPVIQFDLQTFQTPRNETISLSDDTEEVSVDLDEESVKTLWDDF